MTKFLKLTKRLLQKFDLFSTSNYLRYRQQAEFKTATGGVISLVLFGCFFFLFYSMAIQTLNMEIITGTTSYQMQFEPQRLTFQLKNASDFMFSVGILGLNLNDPNVSYFNVTMSQNFYSPIYQDINSTTIPMVPCTPQHYSFNEVTLSMYYRFSLNHYLCPPLYYDFEVRGRIISDIYAKLSIKISYCNKTLNNKCLNDSKLEQLEQIMEGFTLVMPTVSTVVNPTDQNYKQVFLEDRNYYHFSTSQGLQVIGLIQQYEINTDVSLMPYSITQTQKITSVPGLFESKYKPVFDNVYVSISFSKSSTYTTYTRSFNKIDQYFSYVGGIISTFLSFFYIFSVYSEQCYTIDIAEEIYSLTEDSSHSCYNFIYFISVNVKSFLNFIGFKCQWKKSDQFIHALHEMEKQLSLEYLLKRLNFLQDGLSAIYKEDQLQKLYKTGKKSILSATKVREKYHEAQIREAEIDQKDRQLTAIKMVREPTPNNHQNTICFFQTQSIQKFSNLRLFKQDKNHQNYLERNQAGWKQKNAENSKPEKEKQQYPSKHRFRRANRIIPLLIDNFQLDISQKGKQQNSSDQSQNGRPENSIKHQKYLFEDLS